MFSGNRVCSDSDFFSHGVYSFSSKDGGLARWGFEVLLYYLSSGIIIIVLEVSDAV